MTDPNTQIPIDSIAVIQTIAGTRLDHGGTSRSVPNLCEALARRNASVDLVVGTPADPSVACNYPNGNVQISRVVESGFRRQWRMAARFQKQLEERLLVAPDNVVTHDHGMWLATNRATASATRRMSISRIVSPRGMLSQWSMNNGRWKKKIAWWLFQHRDLLTATGFHATGHQEAEDLRSLGFKQPIAVIPNGIVLPDVMPNPRRLQNAGSRSKRCLFLSRIHPKKGLLNLLHVWSDVMQNENWKLVLAGPDENGHQREVEQLADSLGVANQIEFTGSVTDQEKWQLYCESDLFILPSFSENFGIVVAEALAAGIPVITTTPTPWEVLRDRNFGWWVEPEIPELANALRNAVKLSDTERDSMGRAGAAWATEQFGWDGIARQMIEFYQWLLNPCLSKPEFVV